MRAVAGDRLDVGATVGADRAEDDIVGVGRRGRGDLLRLADRRRGPPHRLDRRRGRHGVGVVDVEADAERRVARAEARHRHRGRQRVDAVGAGDHAEQQLQVLDVAAHRPDAAEVEHAGRPGRGPEAGLGDAPGGGTDADAAAVVARQPDRAAAVDADPDQRGVGAHQRGLAAARPTRRPRVVVGVVGAAEEGVVGLGVGGALGDVGLGDDDRARLAQPPRDRAVARRDPVARGDDARGRRPALDVDRVLDRDREAEKGPIRSADARRPLAVRLVRRGQRALRVDRGHRVQLRVRRFDPPQRPLDQLAGADLARLEPRQPGRRRGLGCRAAGSGGRVAHRSQQPTALGCLLTSEHAGPADRR